MKRAYETPMVEKLAFCYRDQVVVASGTNVAEEVVTGGNTPTTGEQIIGRIAEGLNINGCAGYECSSLANIF